MDRRTFLKCLGAAPLVAVIPLGAAESPPFALAHTDLENDIRSMPDFVSIKEYSTTAVQEIGQYEYVPWKGHFRAVNLNKDWMGRTLNNV